jgi:hypothetical protein
MAPVCVPFSRVEGLPSRRGASHMHIFEAATLTRRRLQGYACTPPLVPLAVLPAHCPLHFVAGSRTHRDRACMPTFGGCARTMPPLLTFSRTCLRGCALTPTPPPPLVPLRSACGIPSKAVLVHRRVSRTYDSIVFLLCSSAIQGRSRLDSSAVAGCLRNSARLAIAPP